MRPQNAIRRQRVGVEAFIAVNGRIGKSSQRRPVFQQPADVVIPGIAQQVLIADKRIRPGFPVPQRLVQMSPTRIHIGQGGFRHEAGQQAVTPHQVLDRGAEQQQGIGRGEAVQGIKRHLELARSPFGLNGAQGQFQPGGHVPDDVSHVRDPVHRVLGMVLKAVADCLHCRRVGRLPGFAE